MNNSRINYIDVAKGIGILLVMLAHIIPRNYGFGQWIYSFHMPLFFIVSGILLYNNNSWKKEKISFIFKKKVKKLLYPYLIFSILSIIFFYFFDGKVSLLENIYSSIIFDGIYTLWFLPAIFIAELLFIILNRKIPKKYLFIPFIFLLLITTSFSFLNYRSLDISSLTYKCLRVINIFSRAFIGCIFIFIGFFFGKISHYISKSKCITIFTTVVSLIISILLYKYNIVDLHYSIIGNPIIYYINAILGSYAIINISKISLFEQKYILFYGKNSIVILISHLNFKLVYYSRLLATKFVTNHVSTLTFIILFLIETILIIIINKYFKFLISYDDLKKRFKH